MSPDRILPDLGNIYFTPIAVTADWTTTANAKTDLIAALGMDLSGPTYSIYFFLWEGDDDSDDFACLKIVKSTGSPTYTDEFASSTPWGSAPTTNATAYLIGMSMLA
jgi:hypothetical protein